MKKKKTKLALLIIAILGAIILGIGVYIGISNLDKQKKDPPPMGINNTSGGEQPLDLETKLIIRAIELTEEALNDKYPYKEDGTFTITLAELQRQYHKNLSIFNTDLVTCDIEKSYVIIAKEDKDIYKTANLACTFLEQ